MQLLCKFIGFPFFAFWLSHGQLNASGNSLQGPASPVGELVCHQGLLTWHTIATVVENSQTIVGVAHHTGPDFVKESYDREKRCRFRLRNKSGRTAFKTSVKLVALGGTRSHWGFSAATDWAVLRLAKPVPASVNPIRLAGGISGTFRGDVLVAGSLYQRKFLDREEVNCQAAISRRGAALLRHNCATTPGWSGAPVLVNDKGVIMLIGVHSGREKPSGGLRLASFFPGRLRSRIHDAITF